jgi:putative chitinase
MSILSSLSKIASSVASVGAGIAQALTGQYNSRPIRSKRGDKLGPMENQDLSAATEILGNIYGLMVKARESEVLQKELDKKNIQDKHREEEDRNKEIIKALSIRRKAKKKTPPKKETDQQQKQQTETKTTAKKEVETAKKAQQVKPTAPKAPAEKVPEVKAPAAPKPSIKIPSKAIAGAAVGAAGLLASELAQAGVSEKGQANVLAQVKAESNFVPKSENLNYKSAERIQAVFGKNRIPSVDMAQQFVNNPEALANHVYAKTDGNSEPGDGWKYRGRGYLQHTGKNQYVAIKNYTGIDVVTNPDLLNKPEVASKAVVWFFLNYKKKKPEQLDDINQVNKAVGFAGGAEEAAKRQTYAQQISQNMPAPVNDTSTGSQIDASSKQNKDMKAAAELKSQVNVNNTNITTAQNASKQAMNQEEVDDRPPIHKKS